MDRRFVPLDHDAVRFMANFGADTTIRDWRAVVLEAHRQVGNEVVEAEGGEPRVIKKAGRHVFIGGHSLGGSLTVLYAAYDFDRRPGHELLGKDDVDGLVLFEGGRFPMKKPKTISADSYRRSLNKLFTDGKVYFDMDVLGIRYAPSTMLSLAISGWAADNARGRESVFPMSSRPRSLRYPRLTNEAQLGFAIDDDISPFFIARASIGHPDGELGKQLRLKIATLPRDPNDCPLITGWRPGGRRPMDPDHVYGWRNIDEGPHPAASSPWFPRCAKNERENPEVTEFYAFAAPSTTDRPNTRRPRSCRGDRTTLPSGSSRPGFRPTPATWAPGLWKMTGPS